MQLAPQPLVQERLARALDIVRGYLVNFSWINRVILFGSAARGLAHQLSDLDILVVTDNSMRVDSETRMQILRDIYLKFCTEKLETVDFNILFCSQTSFESPSPGALVSIVKQYGVLLK